MIIKMWCLKNFLIEKFRHKRLNRTFIMNNSFRVVADICAKSWVKFHFLAFLEISFPFKSIFMFAKALLISELFT